MHVDCSYSQPVRGTAVLPPDRIDSLTLPALAAAANTGLAIERVSPSPEVDILLGYLDAAGADAERTADTVHIRSGCSGTYPVIDTTVPDECLSLLVAGALGGGGTAVVANTPYRERIFLPRMMRVLERWGDSAPAVEVGSSTITIGSWTFRGDTEAAVESGWELRTVLLLAGKTTAFTLSHPAKICDHALAGAGMCGWRFDDGDGSSVEDELERRLARSSGEPIPRKCRVFKGKTDDDVVTLAGDSTIAAAVAATAVLLPQSEVVCENVPWTAERRGFFDLLRRMRVPVFESAASGASFDRASVKVGTATPSAVHVSPRQALTMFPEIPVAAALAAAAPDESIFPDTAGMPGLGRDGFTMLADGLRMLNVHVGDYADGIIIQGGHELHGDMTDSVGRPSLALAFAVAAMQATGVTRIFGFDETTYPMREYLGIIRSLGAL